MRLLLDTHIWLWSVLEPSRVLKHISDELNSPANELWLSPVSTWELLILLRKRRVQADDEALAWVAKALAAAPVKEAPLTHEVALESERLDFLHWDPADRFLAATARVYELVLVTADERLIRARGVRTLANRPRRSTSSPTT